MVNDNEFEVLKAQMNVLANSLSKDKVVSEDMIKATISAKAKGVEDKRIYSLLGVALTISVSAYITHLFLTGLVSKQFLVLSLISFLVQAVLGLIDFARNYQENLAGASLVETARNITTWRRQKSIEGIVRGVAIAILLAACLTESWADISTNLTHAICVVLIVAFVLYATTSSYIKKFKASAKLLEEIDEMTNDIHK